MKNRLISTIPPSHYVVITTIIVYVFLVTILFEMDIANGAGANFVVDDNDKTMMAYSSQVEEVEAECKSPCSSSAEICIAMCA